MLRKEGQVGGLASLFFLFLCNKFGFLLTYSYLSPLEKKLSLEKTQINLVFCSLIRIFAGRSVFYY